MKNIKIYSLLLSLFFIGFTQSCTEDFEDINRDPFNPTQASIPTVFNRVTSSLVLGWMEQNSIHNGYYYFVTQQLANAAPRYILAQGVDEIWVAYYTTLKNVRWLESEFAKSELKMDNAQASLNIILAYKTLRTADYYGDMPFTEAGRAAESSDYFRVKYDNHQEIYTYCLDLLKSASESFSSDADQFSLGSGDVLFGGDYDMWKKFANSIRLRYAMQLAEVDASQASAHIGEILGNTAQYPVISGDETLGIWPDDLGITIDSRPWSFSAENLTCLGSTMWNEMSESNAADGSGIVDPRCMVFFETNRENQWAAQQQNGANPVQGRGPYLNAAFPSGRDRAMTQAEWDNKGESAFYSSVNYYLARDDQYLPEIIMTVAEVHFITAEAYLRGIGVAKNVATAKTHYEAGVTSSIEFWYGLVDLASSIWYINQPTLGANDISTYMARSEIAFSSNEDDALKQIYKQIWIDSFRQPWVAFNLYRRTLATPRDESGSYNQAENAFYKLPYPESEKNYNADNFNAALSGKENSPANKLFWHR
ncbi:SusD/RagB family nutrient-binding outer membrane lipoprotein [Sunxiuqinia sp. sy24]|uniref:SusD/RagB family nutrient-binding outer membrane lipoprotein n=1 Tax=Sunxiuqinia sp. sy24 TaxID=3461495 RepID=UPI0040467375